MLAAERITAPRDHWTVGRQKPDGVPTQLKHTGFHLFFHRPDSQLQLLTVLLVTHQSSAVNSAHSTVPPLLNLPLSCWYVEDSPPDSSQLISTVLLSRGQSNVLPYAVSRQPPDFLWTVWQSYSLPPPRAFCGRRLLSWWHLSMAPMWNPIVL